MINRVARNQTIKKIPHLVEQILHLPLPDVAGEVPDVDRAAPAPAHPSPTKLEGSSISKSAPAASASASASPEPDTTPPQENKSRRQRGTGHGARTTRGTMRKGDSYLNSCGRREIEVEARVLLLRLSAVPLQNASKILLPSTKLS